MVDFSDYPWKKILSISIFPFYLPLLTIYFQTDNEYTSLQLAKVYSNIFGSFRKNYKYYKIEILSIKFELHYLYNTIYRVLCVNV